MKQQKVKKTVTNIRVKTKTEADKACKIFFFTSRFYCFWGDVARQAGGGTL